MIQVPEKRMDVLGKFALQAIFFDFDGVIIDSTLTKTQAFYSLFAGFDDDIVDQVVAYHQQHGGISRVEKIDYAHHNIIGKKLEAAEVAQWAARYSELVFEKVIGVEWIPGAKEFLETKPEGLPCFVISGTPEDELRRVLERRGISNHFSEILGSPVRKPNHIRKILSGYQLSAKRCVFVGDALTDYNAAYETGLHFIGIQGEVPFPEGTVVLKDCCHLHEAITSILS